MAVSSISNHQTHAALVCVHCSHPLDHASRFCGECGASRARARHISHEESFVSSFQRVPTFVHHHQTDAPAAQSAGVAPSSDSLNNATTNNARRQAHQLHAAPAPHRPQSALSSPVAAAPNFARVRPKGAKEISPAMKEEIGNLICNLARERMFLLLHWCVFLGMNSAGLFLAFTAYNGYIGDEMTKTVMALTPMFFINTIALACLSPIKGTKLEIERVKEKLRYLKLQVEYDDMF